MTKWEVNSNFSKREINDKISLPSPCGVPDWEDSATPPSAANTCVWEDQTQLCYYLAIKITHILYYFRTVKGSHWYGRQTGSQSHCPVEWVCTAGKHRHPHPAISDTGLDHQGPLPPVLLSAQLYHKDTFSCNTTMTSYILWRKKNLYTKSTHIYKYC